MTPLDCVNIAAAGGGLVLDAVKFTPHDLVNIAAAAKTKQARIDIKNMKRLTTTDMVNIAAAGGGVVQFHD